MYQQLLVDIESINNIVIKIILETFNEIYNINFHKIFQ